MAKKIGVGFSFKEKTLEKENGELKEEIKKLRTTSKKSDNNKKDNSKKAE